MSTKSKIEDALRTAVCTSCTPATQTALLKSLEEELIFTVGQALDQDNDFFKEAGVKRGELSTLREKLKTAQGEASKTIPDMNLFDLLTAFADGEKEAYKALESKVSVVLVSKEKIDIQATVDLYEKYFPVMQSLPTEGTTFGPKSLEVVSLASCADDRVEIDPIDDDLLIEGFNNRTKNDWSKVSSCLMRNLARFTKRLDASVRPREQTIDVIMDLEGKTTLEQIRENRRWWNCVDAYGKATKEDLNLERQLQNQNYPPKDHRRKPASAPMADAFVPSQPSIAISGGNVQIGSNNTQAITQQLPLTGSQLKELREAILDAFYSRDLLRVAVSDILGIHLDTISVKGALETTVFDILQYTEARSLTKKFVLELIQANPGNPALRAYAVKYSLKSRFPSLPNSRPFHEPWFRALRDEVLANLYPTDESIRRVLSDARIATGNIGFENAAQSTWHNALTQVCHAGAGNALLETVYRQYPREIAHWLAKYNLG